MLSFIHSASNTIQLFPTLLIYVKDRYETAETLACMYV